MIQIYLPALLRKALQAGEYIAKSRIKKILPFTLAILLILFDQASKYLVRHKGGFYICNQGVAFGIEIPQLWLWLLISLVLTSFLILNKLLNLKFKNFDLIENFKFRISNYALILILSGAISNIIDRLYFGCVIDFINPPFGPIFNLADVFISIGVIITVVSIYKYKKIL
jgi:signal peptidase II